MDPKAIKQMEKIIAKEAKGEEKDLQNAMKDLHETEKSEVKANKVSSSLNMTLFLIR